MKHFISFKPAIFAILVLFLCCCAAPALDMDQSWLNPRSREMIGMDWKAVPATDFYEVVKSKFDIAKAIDLAQKRCVPLTEDQAKSYTGSYYSCPKGKRPYLIRAEYGQAGTGHYEVSRWKNTLLVSHDSLGHRSTYNLSALVVNLDFAPDDVYVEVSIAE